MSLLTGFLANWWWAIALVVIAIAALQQPVAVWKAKAWILAAVIAWWGWTGHAAHNALRVAYAEHLAADATAAADIAADQLTQERTARQQERAVALQLAAAAQSLEEAKTDAQNTERAVVTDLRSDNLRLRQHWQGCVATSAVSAAAASASQRDAAADVRDAAAGAVVRVGADADAAVAACQAVVRAYEGAGQ